MATHVSAKKRIVRNAKRAKINASRRGSMRTAVKKVEAALVAGNAKAAEEALKAAQPQLQRGTQKRIISKKAASRKISRLSKRAKALKSSGKSSA